MKRLLKALLKFLNSRKRRILMVGALVLSITACTAGTTMTQAYAEPKKLNSEHKVLTVNTVSNSKSIFLQQAQSNAYELSITDMSMKANVKALRKTAGHTWYVFSGATPAGWDCSGLVVWFYGRLGVTLEHSATKQLHSGKHVKTPKIGDIVAFSYPGSSGSFHVGIYIGNGKLIHAYYYGKRTVIEPVAQVQRENGNAKVTYVRINY